MSPLPPPPPPTSKTNVPGSLASDIRSLLHSEGGENGDDEENDIHDVTLVGIDGTSIPSIKAILSARSKVFRRMFYGKFAEHSKKEVRLEYDGVVLGMLVDFCFTDDIRGLDDVSAGSNDSNDSNGSSSAPETSNGSPNDSNEGKHGSSGNKVAAAAETSSSCSPEEKVRNLTKLSGAAHYFDIPRLEIDVKDRLCAFMSESPSLACAVLDEAAAGGDVVIAGTADDAARAAAAAVSPNGENGSNLTPGISPALETLSNLAMEKIRMRPKASLLPSNDCGGGVSSLNSSLLGQVIFDDKSPATELTKFLCIKRWADHFARSEATVDAPSRKVSEEKQGLEDSSPSDSSANIDDPLTIAKSLAKRIDLSLIPASELSLTITDSQLVSTTDLYHAYRLQALNAERTKAKVFVEGAGLTEVNGTYTQGGLHEGHPMYNKEGLWRDQEHTFRIFLCTYSNGNKSWCISIVPRGKQPGKTTDLDFYESPAFGNPSTSSGGFGGNGEAVGIYLIPRIGWKPVNYGQPPSPKCTLMAGCLGDT